LALCHKNSKDSLALWHKNSKDSLALWHLGTFILKVSHGMVYRESPKI